MSDAYSLFYDPLKNDTSIGPLDPFKGSATQTNRMRAFCEVYVAGVDITSRIEPHLISVRFVDGGDWKCEIEVDDRDAKLPIPPIGSPVQVRLGWAREQMYTLFTGIIEDFEHGFGRKQGGRRMWVHAKGTSQVKTKVKEPMQDSLGDGAPPGKQKGTEHSAMDWLQQVAGRGGVTATINSAFAGVKRDHWSMMNGSPAHTIQQLGEELGAVVQFQNNHVAFMLPGELGVVCRAVWRDNLIGWRVRPFAARSAWKGAQADSFDKRFGQWNKFVQDKLQIKGPPGADATGGSPGPASTDSAADQANSGATSSMDSAYMGVGRIVINGEPRAKMNGFVMLEGARPGVDGLYLITVAEHIYSRQGYVTWLDVITWGRAGSADSVFSGFLPRPNPNIG